jgi:hypothetical protein
MVMPPFASPGKAIRIFPDSGSFAVGGVYRVDFGGSAVVETVAKSSDSLEVVVPDEVGTDPGPKALHVQGPGVDHYYSEALFTALPPAPALPTGSGVYAVRKYLTAISADGALLLPLDVSALLDPMQLAFAFSDLPLDFDADDVVFYNADGVDLTLFTLDVVDSAQRQWGSYFGWTVEDDAGLFGDVYDTRVEKAKHSSYLPPNQFSDVLTYWRHEFHTYAQAHAPGGSHEVDANGYHPDGTLHIDHGNLVISISGRLRDPSDPEDVEPLDPGKHETDVVLVAIESPFPIEPNLMTGTMEAALFEAD